MIQNETRILDCLFLHDTQMTRLEREQTALRKIVLLRQPVALPFNFSPPFCPIPKERILHGKLEIGAPVVRAGWIVRPVSDAREGQAEENSAPAAPPAAIPGYPALPQGMAFILGYAGSAADSVLAELAGRAPSEAGDGFGSSFTVNARYRATLTLEVSYESGRQFSCTRTVGPAHWEKA